MDNNSESINQLLQKLQELMQKQDAFAKEINALKEEIYALRPAQKPLVQPPSSPVNIPPPVEHKPFPPFVVDKEIFEPRPVAATASPAAKPLPTKPAGKTNFEKFIGENLISKIGIGITIIGVGIGAKYSIDHELISPLTRIILGYLVGIGLIVFGIKLKKNYEAFSAVLVSGAMAIMYFLTYAAYSFYNLIPQLAAFMLMVVFTIFTVIAAINYNRQLIAHIGLVGAYGVPFLLSNGSDQVAILFSYMAIINAGILAIAVKKYWKQLYYSSFLLSWLIYFAWFAFNYERTIHFRIAFVFAIIFFLLFYVMIGVYKIYRSQKFGVPDIVLLLLNSFIFYSIGYALLNGYPQGSQLLGLFTLANAVVHFIAGYIIYKQKAGDKNFLHLVIGLVLTFITIAIPVQLNGHWVTLLWAGEALFLFWIGYSKNLNTYKWLAWPVIALAFVSLVQDWLYYYADFDIDTALAVKHRSLLNIQFLSSILVSTAFGAMVWIDQRRKAIPEPAKSYTLHSVFSFGLVAAFLVVLYFSFQLEIGNYWDQLYRASYIKFAPSNQFISDSFYNEDLPAFKKIWIINYTLLFLTLLSWINIKKIRSQQLGLINSILNALAIVCSLAIGLYTLALLRESYVQQTLAKYYGHNAFNIGIRYLSFAFIAVLLYTTYQYIRQPFMKINATIGFDFLLYGSLLWVISSEFITQMDLAGSGQSYKLGLSIVWGIYALLIVSLGIWKKKKHLRIAAIALFGGTLIKLFFYDIAHLNTIAKTVVFVSLGILLLIVSFLYNKYKHIIADETGE